MMFKVYYLQYLDFRCKYISLNIQNCISQNTGMDLAVLCDVELKLAPVDVIWLFSVFMESLPAICDSGVPTIPTSTPVELLQ